ncbi:hypothetical protein ACU19_04900 [Actinobaculum suis]|uniref:hypothetical protein n=1 Tax=Actinobaculum suis TaxID=1657 RepID=UPI00066FB7BF|nr:hypothetical protein [Actinobaculum suis]KMY23313.1 hypothetical protein ACU19_04900 [Actinobaculum suis]
MAKGTTRLSDDVTKPQPTQAGDAPADTTDATEEATSVRPDKGAAAKAGHQTVNAVRPAKTKRVKKTVNPGSRTETYTAHKPDGTEVQVTHDLETGQTTVAPG